MKVEIFGAGCAKCRLLERRVKEVVKELGKDIEVVKIESIEEIMERGITMIPALAIDGDVKIKGRVPKKEEIKELLGNN